MSTKSLNKALGIDDDELDQIIKNAEKGVDSGLPAPMGTTLSQEEIDKFNEKREALVKMKETLTLARNMSDKDWAKNVIKTGVDTAMMVQLRSAQDIEDDYRSNKVQSISELTNAIVNGAKAVVDIEQGERNLDIQQERNTIRKAEVMGKVKTLDAPGGETTRLGTKKDLLALIKGGIDPSAPINNSDSEKKEIEVKCQ